MYQVGYSYVPRDFFNKDGSIDWEKYGDGKGRQKNKSKFTFFGLFLKIKKRIM